MRQAQADTPLRPMPFVVLSHSRTIPNPFDFPLDFPIEALESAFQDSQDMLARLVPRAKHVIATKSTHYIQIDQPRLVTDAIHRVVRKVRKGLVPQRADDSPIAITGGTGAYDGAGGTAVATQISQTETRFTVRLRP